MEEEARLERWWTELRANRADWISAARRVFYPGRREPCHLCGKFRGVTHAHHIVPLAEQYRRGFTVPDSEHAWLCPSHHAVIHFLIDGNPSVERLGARAAPALADLDVEEIEKIMDLVRRSGRWPA